MATTKIELYNGATLVATKTSAPFTSIDWTPVTTGAATLTAKRYEDGVLVATSSVKNYTVNAASGGYEAETTAYFTQVGWADDATARYAGTAFEKTGAQLWGVVDTAIKSLKTEGLFTSIRNMRIKIGTTQTQHAVDLINPASGLGTYVGANILTDGNGTYHQGITHFNSGVLMNTDPDNLGLTLVAFSPSGQFNKRLTGGYNTTEAKGLYLTGGTNTGTNVAIGSGNTQTQMLGITPAIVTVNKAAGTTTGFRNGVKEATVSNASQLPAYNIIEAMYIENGTAKEGYAGYLGTSIAHNPLTDAQVVSLHTIITQLELDLNRKNW